MGPVVPVLLLLHCDHRQPMRNVIGDEQRKYGRAAVKQRKRRLRNEPLCRHCADEGHITAATVPDHIVPLSHGGSDDDSNIQCLCAQCHDRKTRREFGYKQKQNVDADGWPISNEK